MKVIPPSIPERTNAPKQMSVVSGTGIESIGNEIFDAECLKLINEYFYAIRIFPGQDPTHVYVGWVTTQFHLHSKEFNQSKVRKSTVHTLDEFSRVNYRYVIFNLNMIFISFFIIVCIFMHLYFLSNINLVFDISFQVSRFLLRFK